MFLTQSFFGIIPLCSIKFKAKLNITDIKRVLPVAEIRHEKGENLTVGNWFEEMIVGILKAHQFSCGTFMCTSNLLQSSDSQTVSQ